MKQIAEARDAEWESNRQTDESPTSQFKARIREAMKKKAVIPSKVEKSRRKTSRLSARDPSTPKSFEAQHDRLADLRSVKARFIEPMKAKLVEKPPATGGWIYELKFDGIRLIAVKRDKKVSLFSRNQNDLSPRFPEIVDAIKNLPARECVIDGEVVALDDEGRSSFQLLQAREIEGGKSPIYFYAFDLLQLDGKSLIGLPLEARKNVLEKLCANAGDPIRYSGAIGSDAKRLLQEVKHRGLEGIIGKQAAHGSSSNVSMNRNSSLADTRHRRARANISAQSWLVTMTTTRWCLPAKSAPGSLPNRYRCCTRDSKKKRATIVHSSICHQNKTGNGSRGSRRP